MGDDRKRAPLVDFIDKIAIRHPKSPNLYLNLYLFVNLSPSPMIFREGDLKKARYSNEQSLRYTLSRQNVFELFQRQLMFALRHLSQINLLPLNGRKLIYTFKAK